MILAIGTKSPPKVKAIQEASQTCVYFEGKAIELISEKVESGVSDMPLSLEENITGARNRAHNMKKLLDSQNKTADFYVGMEGGTTIIEEKAYLFGAVYIIDNHGNGHLGLSPFMEVPELFKKRIYENQEELGPVLAEITGTQNVSKKTGAFGHWSDNMLTRQDQFMLAFTSAICPFYNKYYKLK